MILFNFIGFFVGIFGTFGTALFFFDYHDTRVEWAKNNFGIS